MKKILLLTLTLFVSLSVTNSASAQLLKGAKAYLTPDQLPNMVNWLPEPPSEDSAAFDYDISRYNWGKEQRKDVKRAERAIRHASIDPVVVCSHFSEAFGLEISPENTPQIYRLLIDGMETANNISLKPKKHYSRQRPFSRFNEPTLVPKAEDVLRNNGSYPSGHTIIGFSGALLLAQINPEAADALLKEGYECGQSRIITGFHWQSDVDAARIAASVAVVAMQNSKAFCKQMRRAKREFEKKRK
ncbi:MAG: phosphatase PAP2 family protein [Alistipes sp.]|nr:phosphatase PAP2 family protein [Alistipes sp.]